MDTKEKIHDLRCSLAFDQFHHDSWGNFLSKRDYFGIVNYGLYYMLTLATYHFFEFVTWLSFAYVPQKNYVASSTREVILEVTFDIIHKDLFFPNI